MEAEKYYHYHIYNVTTRKDGSVFLNASALSRATGAYLCYQNIWRWLSDESLTEFNSFMVVE